jgi:hypothetical protein
MCLFKVDFPNLKFTESGEIARIRLRSGPGGSQLGKNGDVTGRDFEQIFSVTISNYHWLVVSNMFYFP